MPIYLLLHIINNSIKIYNLKLCFFHCYPHAHFTIWLALVCLFVCFFLLSHLELAFFVHHLYHFNYRQKISQPTENSLHTNFDFCVFFFVFFSFFHFSRIFRNKCKSVTLKIHRFYSKNYCLIRQIIPWNVTHERQSMWTMTVASKFK